MNAFAIMALINVATSTVIGLLVLFADRRARLNQLFALFAAAVIWWSFSYFSWQISSSAAEALFWTHMFMAGALCITPVYFHFTAHLLNVVRKYRTFVTGGYIFIAIFSVANWSPWFITGLSSRPTLGFERWPDPGVLFHPFLAIWIFYALLSVYLLLRDYFGAQIQPPSTTRLILLGTVIGYLGGCTNYFLWYSIPVLPLGNISASIYTAIVAYAIMKNRLFNMKVIATELLIFALWLFLFFRMLVADSYAAQALEASLLAASLVIGVLLIRSVDNEVQQRELIEKQRGELEKANQKQENLLHFISHEVKGYMTKSEAAFSAISTGDFGPISSDLKSMSELALDDMRKGVNTITDILDASNLKKGTVSYAHKKFDLTQAIEDVADDLRKAAVEKGLTLSFHKPVTGACLVDGDEDKIRRHVIRNIIDNSIKYTLSGAVKVDLVRDGATLRIVVSDTGVGISPEDMKHLFTEGGHGKDSIRINVHSTGYGLFIAKEIVDAHGGKIWAESDGEGRGSRFIVELPSA